MEEFALSRSIIDGVFAKQNVPHVLENGCISAARQRHWRGLHRATCWHVMHRPQHLQAAEGRKHMRLQLLEAAAHGKQQQGCSS